ncbi:unnamed protein product, partial [Oikopleura dioica]
KRSLIWCTKSTRSFRRTRRTRVTTEAKRQAAAAKEVVPFSDPETRPTKAAEIDNQRGYLI